MNFLGALVVMTYYVTCTYESDIFDFGSKYGLQNELKNDISPTNLHRIEQGVLQNKPESLYLMGLMLYYGHGLSKNTGKAIQLFRRACLFGYLDAEFTLGYLLLQGTNGLATNHLNAFKYLKRCADKGHADCQWLVGGMYKDGKGVDRNYHKAFKMFKQSSEKQNSRGHFHLGIMYEYGIQDTIPQDFSKAADLYSKAANDGVMEAQYYLGLMMLYGRGFAQDFKKAMMVLTKAAERGYYPAMIYLGRMYTHGQGAPIDYSMALLWFKKASLSPDRVISDEARQYFNELNTLMQRVKVNMDKVNFLND